MNPSLRRPFRSWAVVFLLPAAVLAAPEEAGTLATKLDAAPAPLALKLDLYGNGWESTVTQSRIAGAEVRGELVRKLAPEFSVQLGAALVVEAGVARSRFTDEFRPRQGVRLREASVQWNPWAPLTVAAGALDQDRWDAPLLLRRQSYPGVYERFAQKLGAFTVALEAVQSVVNDTSTLQRWGNWAEGLPSFFLERASVEWKKTDRTRVRAHVSHYGFRDLSHQQAFDAQFLGNTVQGVGPEVTTFVYGFQGFEAGAEASVEVATGWSPFLRGDVLWNHLAPGDRGLGWSVATGVLWERGDKLRFRPSLEVFQVGSDVSPALFSTRTFGHGNRRGFAASLAVELPTDHVRGQLQWVSSSVLVPSPVQDGANWLNLQMSMDL